MAFTEPWPDSTSLNAIGMKWNVGCKPEPLAQYQCLTSQVHFWLHKQEIQWKDFLLHINSHSLGMGCLTSSYIVAVQRQTSIAKKATLQERPKTSFGLNGSQWNHTVLLNGFGSFLFIYSSRNSYTVWTVAAVFKRCIKVKIDKTWRYMFLSWTAMVWCPHTFGYIVYMFVANTNKRNGLMVPDV